MYQKEKQHDKLPSDRYVSLAINILSATSRLENFMFVSLKKFGLTLPQFNALWVLAKHNPRPMALKQLTEHMIDKSSNTSRLVDKLAEKKLVNRDFVPNDRRIIHVTIAESGLELIDEVIQILEVSLKTRFINGESGEPNKLIEEFLRLQMN